MGVIVVGVLKTYPAYPTDETQLEDEHDGAA